ncbi:MAG TPA: cell division protein FtsA [Candidatus Paceibacterota bacterium]|nr:cell division protein FtsA [Candidatus Paceibacterota bacterium]
MSKRNIVTGIDVGSAMTRVVICEALDPSAPPQIIGTGAAETHGLRRGYMVNVDSAAKSIALAVSRAEKAAGTKIDSAFFSAGGVGLEGTISVGSALVSQADGEVGAHDVERACISAESFVRDNSNKKVLHTVPISFRLDGKEVLGRPRGMKGMKLEAKALVITALSQHINDLISAADLAGVEVLDVLPAPIAASWVVLSKQQKTAGCALTDIGSETVSVTVFENSLPVSLQVFPVGSTDMTNDIALGLQVSLEEAEKFKVGRLGDTKKPELEAITEKRLTEIFGMVEAHLKKIDRNELLPAGIILIGGGSGIKTAEAIAKNFLKLPSSIGVLHYRERGRSADFAPARGNGRKNFPQKTMKDGPSWAIAYGLCVLGSQDEQDETILAGSKDLFDGFKAKVSKIFKQFLP